MKLCGGFDEWLLYIARVAQLELLKVALLAIQYCPLPTALRSIR
jgi:hypothetical protein